MMLYQYLASVHNEGSVLDDGLIGRLAADEHKVCGGVERLDGDTGSSLAIASWGYYLVFGWVEDRRYIAHVLQMCCTCSSEMPLPPSTRTLI